MKDVLEKDLYRSLKKITAEHTDQENWIAIFQVYVWKQDFIGNLGCPAGHADPFPGEFINFDSPKQRTLKKVKVSISNISESNTDRHMLFGIILIIWA